MIFLGRLESAFKAVAFEACDVLNSAKRNSSEYAKVEALKHCIDKRWSTFTCNGALSKILELPVLSFCRLW